MSTSDFDALTPCNHFVPLINKSLMNNIFEGRGVYAEDIICMKSTTSLEAVDMTIREIKNDTKNALEESKQGSECRLKVES